VNLIRRLALGACVWVLNLPTFALAQAKPPEPCRGEILTHVEGLAAAEAKRADDLRNADGLMWRIEKPNLAPSYLFGTMHSTDGSALEIARRAAELIKGVKVAATELGGPIDLVEKANTTAAMLAKALDRDHDTFQGVIPPEDRESVEKFLAGQGYPAEFAHHLKPWFLAILTALPKCEAEREALNLPEVDQFLAQTARDAGVQVIGLETPQEQIDLIATIRPEVAAALLALSARDPGMIDNAYATMVQLYHDGRPAEILPIGDALESLSENERAAQEEFMRVLLVGRNAVMAERAAPLLASGGAFIAVGALHLTGKDGLIERFRADGYTVTKVW
jgi:uncharacterized protein YbaP (TraB family)